MVECAQNKKRRLNSWLSSRPIQPFGDGRSEAGETLRKLRKGKTKKEDK
jgi:hypothetical protein